MLITVHTINLMAVSLIPLGAYLLLLGFINVAGRTVVLPGSLDTALLAGAISGLLVTGIISLLFEATPLYRFYRLAPWTPWAAYLLAAVAWILHDSNRIVLYCVREKDLERAIWRVAEELGQTVRRAGTDLEFVLHPSEVTLCVHFFETLEAATVRISAPDALATIRRRLARALREQVPASSGPRWSLPGLVFTFAGTVLVAYPTVWLVAINTQLILRLLPQ